MGHKLVIQFKGKLIKAIYLPSLWVRDLSELVKVYAIKYPNKKGFSVTIGEERNYE